MEDMQSLPGIGPAMARDFTLLGINTPSDLIGRDAGQLYAELCAKTGLRQDRCVLYVFRCAVWAAEHPDSRDENLRRWWNWKD